MSRGPHGRFVAGQGSANPGGRPKIGSEWRQLIRDVTDNGKMILEKLVEIVQDQEIAPSIRLDALRYLADSGFGKPITTMEIETSSVVEHLENPRTELARLSVDELRALRVTLKKAEGRELDTADQKVLDHLSRPAPRQAVLTPVAPPAEVPVQPAKTALEFEDAVLEPQPALPEIVPVAETTVETPAQTSVVPENEAKVVDIVPQLGPFRVQRLVHAEPLAKPASWRDDM